MAEKAMGWLLEPPISDVITAEEELTPEIEQILERYMKEVQDSDLLVILAKECVALKECGQFNGNCGPLEKCGNYGDAP
jgi:hypothetical protein